MEWAKLGETWRKTDSPKQTVRHVSFTLASSNQVHGSGFRRVTPVNGVGETWQKIDFPK